MSASYTLHVADGAIMGDPRALDRADLVRDGFSWGAFLVPSLWFFRHRHWLLGLGAIALVIGVAVALWLAGAGAGTILAAEFVLHLFIGFEGPSLRRWSYGRRGRPAVDVVYGANEAEAEAKSFARWLADPPVSARQPIAARTASVFRRTSEPVIGLFPDMEGRR